MPYDTMQYDRDMIRYDNSKIRHSVIIIRYDTIRCEQGSPALLPRAVLPLPHLPVAMPSIAASRSVPLSYDTIRYAASRAALHSCRELSCHYLTCLSQCLPSPPHVACLYAVGTSGPQRWGAGDRPRKLMTSTPTTPTHDRAPKRRARVDKKTSGSFVLFIDPCAPLSRAESTSFLK